MPVVAEFESLSEQLARTTTECERLREENARLRNLLAVGEGDGEPAEPTVGTAIVVASTPVSLPRTEPSVADKIALFRSLFRGRDDVYAVHWEGADGKSGYAPASLRDWKALSSVPLSERRKQDKATRQLLPLTDEVIFQHLSGKITVGVYPLLADETCWFLAADFDGESWNLDAQAFVESCRGMKVPAVLERSRSGKGAHVWVFFAAPIAAALARRLGAGLLTKAMASRHQVRLRSYDRLFPNQDTMPTGGFGNLIALPLQKKPRRDDNSVFVDDQLKPIADQWGYLAAVARMEPVVVETLDAAVWDFAPALSVLPRQLQKGKAASVLSGHQSHLGALGGHQ